MDTSSQRLKSAFLNSQKLKRAAVRQLEVVVLALLLSVIASVIAPSSILLGRLNPGITNAEAPGNAPDSDTQFIEHTVLAGQTLRRIAMSYGSTVSDLREANEMAPEETIRPGQKLKVPDSGTIQASWYGSWFNGRPMANQKPYNVTKRVIAHRYLPLGTCVELTNPQNNKTAVAEVQDRINARFAYRWDLSPQIFTKELGISPAVGVATLDYRIVDCKASEKSLALNDKR